MIRAALIPARARHAAVKRHCCFNYSYRDDRSMKDGDRQRLRETLVRAGNTGLTRAQLQAILGLTPAAVDAFFTGPMTVRLDISGAARLVTDASITCNMRLFGD